MESKRDVSKHRADDAEQHYPTKATADQQKCQLVKVSSSGQRVDRLRGKIKVYPKSTQTQDNLLERMIRKAAKKATARQEDAVGFAETERFIAR